MKNQAPSFQRLELTHTSWQAQSTLVSQASYPRLCRKSFQCGSRYLLHRVLSNGTGTPFQVLKPQWLRRHLPLRFHNSLAER